MAPCLPDDNSEPKPSWKRCFADEGKNAQQYLNTFKPSLLEILQLEQETYKLDVDLLEFASVQSFVE